MYLYVSFLINLIITLTKFEKMSERRHATFIHKFDLFNMLFLVVNRGEL